MSSWLTGGLSSLTDQISSFTKDVISETTQEIQDPLTELEIANKRISELSEQTTQYTTELERLRRRNEEYRERAETAEYQVGSNKEQYLKLLKERESEVEELRKQMSNMKDQHRKIILSTRSDSNLPSLANDGFKNIGNYHTGLSDNTGNHGNGPGGFESEFSWTDGGWHDDFDTLGEYHISQSQINQLQSEIARISVECQHWKDLAQKKQKETSKRLDSVSLSDQLEELHQQMEQEKQHHEYELTALQTIHHQQLEAIALKHKTELETLKQTLLRNESENDEKQANDEVLAERDSLRIKNSHLVERLLSNQHLILNLRQSIDDLKHLVHNNQDNQLLHFESEKENLTNYLHDIQLSFQMHQDTISSLQNQRDKYEKETEVLSKEVNELSTNLMNKEMEIGNNQTTNENVETDVSLQLELQEKLEKEQMKREKLQSHLSEIVSEHNKELQEILDSKEQLEISLSQAQNELESEKNEKMSIEQKLSESELVVQQDIFDRKKELEVEREKSRQLEMKLNDALTECSNQSDKIKHYVESLTESQNALQQKYVEINELKRTLNIKEQELKRQSEESMEKINVLSLQFSQEQNENRELKMALEKRHTNGSERNIEEIKLLKQQKEELFLNCENLRTKLEKTEHDLFTLTDKYNNINEELDRKSNQLEELNKERNTLLQNSEKSEHPQPEQLLLLQKENSKYKKDLERLREHLLHVEEQHTQEVLQSQQIENELTRKLKETENKLVNLNDQSIQVNQQAELKISQLQKQFEEVCRERDIVRSELSVAKEEVVQNVSALQNLQNVLECFQKDQSNEIKLSLLKKEHELQSMKEEIEKLKKEHNKTSELTSNESTENVTQLLQVELTHKNKTIADLSSELEKYKLTLNKFRRKIEQMSSEEDSKVDKSLVKNLFVTYVSAQDKQKQEEIANLIGKILEIPSQQLHTNKRGWLRSFWEAPPSPSLVATPTNEQSFSKIFVSFLESESTRSSSNKAAALPIPSHRPPPSHIFVSQQASPTIIQPPIDTNTTADLEKLLDTTT